MGVKVAPDDRVEVDGRPIRPIDLAYVLLNKPTDIITTITDDRDRQTVMDLSRPPRPTSSRPCSPSAGSTARRPGALLLTTDGDLAHRLMHPRYGTVKHYRRDGNERADHARPGPPAPRRRAGRRPGQRRPRPVRRDRHARDRARAPRGPQPPDPAHDRGAGPPRRLARPRRLRRPRPRRACAAASGATWTRTRSTRSAVRLSSKRSCFSVMGVRVLGTGNALPALALPQSPTPAPYTP